MAEIEEIRGNIFTTPCEVIVNTVNCVGVMGAGLALECRYRFPGLLEFYQLACKTEELTPGKLVLFSSSSPKVLCFPTKRHWKDPSKLDYVKAGLEEFVRTYRDHGIGSAAFPHLGCSLGGLSWERQVRPIMLELLAPLADLRVEIYDFDPRAADPLFDELVKRLHGLTRKEIGERLELRSQSVVEMPLAHLLAPHRPGDFSKVIYKDGNSYDLRPENLLRATERQAEIWYLLLALVGTDHFEQVLTSCLEEVADDRDFLCELQEWFDSTSSATRTPPLRTPGGSIRSAWGWPPPCPRRSAAWRLRPLTELLLPHLAERLAHAPVDALASLGAHSLS